MSRGDVLRGAGFLALVFVVAFAGMWAGQELRSRRAPTGPGAGPGGEIDSDLVTGAPFPAVRVVEPDGTARDTAELTAGGAVVLFLRADCPACGLTVDRWREAVATGALAGVPVVGITTDPAETIPAFRQAKGVPFPVYGDPDGTFAREHGVTVVPFVVAVAPGGEIRERQVGHRDDADLQRLARLATE